MKNQEFIGQLRENPQINFLSQWSKFLLLLTFHGKTSKNIGM